LQEITTRVLLAEQIDARLRAGTPPGDVSGDALCRDRLIIFASVEFPVLPWALSSCWVLSVT
jgi:hypothetical protein